MSKLSSDTRSLAYEAYIYLYPLVTMEVSRRQAVNTPAGSRPGFGPPNEFHHLREFPSAEFRAVVRPNFDTLYSSAWLDLSHGPVVVEAADTDDRYYMLPMLDMWTDVFFNPGKRTTGTGPQRYALTAPGYAGELPGDAEHIAAPTAWVWVIGRTQTNGPADYPAVGRVQDGFTITAPDAGTHTVDAEQDISTEPVHYIDALSPEDYFALACEALQHNPPHSTDLSILARIAGIGIVPGKAFDASGLDVAELAAGAKAGREAIGAALPTLGRLANGWILITDTIGVYGNAYLKRAAVSLLGLGANPPEDAIYPLLVADADGAPTEGDHAYVMHFGAEELPPVEAFWSITMYDAEGYQVANEIDRFAIGDRDDLTYNAVGSLDIFIQPANPGADRQSNWLPSPASGRTGITMRLYGPRAGVLAGHWAPPALRRQ